MGRRLKLEQIANEAAKLLIPLFYEAYSIPIRKPPIRAPIWRNKRDFSGLFLPEGRTGVIQINREYCNAKKGYHGVVAHELGHAAAYQHHNAYFNSTGDNVKDYIYDALSEGIAMEFEKTGIEALARESLITPKEFNIEFNYYLESISAKPMFRIGHKLVNLLKARAEMKEIVYSPEKHFGLILENYGHEIIKAAKA